jgi:hypothetical protein
MASKFGLGSEQIPNHHNKSRSVDALPFHLLAVLGSKLHGSSAVTFGNLHSIGRDVDPYSWNLYITGPGLPI